MRRPDARRFAPVLVLLVAVTGLLPAGQDGGRAGAAAVAGPTVVWATGADVEAVLPAKVETALERTVLAGSSKQRSALAVLVPALLVASVLARRAMLPADVPASPALSPLSLAERGPPPPPVALT